MTVLFYFPSICTFTDKFVDMFVRRGCIGLPSKPLCFNAENMSSSTAILWAVEWSAIRNKSLSAVVWVTVVLYYYNTFLTYITKWQTFLCVIFHKFGIHKHQSTVSRIHSLHVPMVYDSPKIVSMDTLLPKQRSRVLKFKFVMSLGIRSERLYGQ